METATLGSTMARLRAETRQQHVAAENSGFITDLLGGRLSLAAYTDYLTQYALIYQALESRSALPGDPPLLTDARLHRAAAIEADLAVLGASAAAPLAATTAYVNRLEEVAAGPWQGYFPHHYTRYLGDMSGGQAMAKLLSRHYGATPAQLTFFDFDKIDNLVKYKRSYREQIDALAISASVVDAMVAECQAAFAFNAAVFAELAERTPPPAKVAVNQ